MDDLLDDGIENNSDLANAVFSNDPEIVQNPQTLEIREKTIAQLRAQEAQALLKLQRKNFSYLGIFLGLVLTGSGALLIARPVDMRVEHTRIKYLPTVFEHVTPGRSRLYGASILVFGLLLAAYSLHRPRS